MFDGIVSALLDIPHIVYAYWKWNKSAKNIHGIPKCLSNVLWQCWKKKWYDSVVVDLSLQIMQISVET